MAKPKSSKSKKTSGKKKGKMASKKQAAEPDQANTVLIQLKKLRDDYLLNSAFYLCNEPILIKRFDKAVTSLEPIDKILINNASITFNDMYSIAFDLSCHSIQNLIGNIAKTI